MRPQAKAVVEAVVEAELEVLVEVAKAAVADLGPAKRLSSWRLRRCLRAWGRVVPRQTRRRC
jgi:hypothetical protein